MNKKYRNWRGLYANLKLSGQDKSLYFDYKNSKGHYDKMVKVVKH